MFIFCTGIFSRTFVNFEDQLFIKVVSLKVESAWLHRALMPSEVCGSSVIMHTAVRIPPRRPTWVPRSIVQGADHASPMRSSNYKTQDGARLVHFSSYTVLSVHIYCYYGVPV